MSVEHQGVENPPALVQLEWVTPLCVKGNTHEAPDTVEHPEDEDEVVVVTEFVMVVPETTSEWGQHACPDNSELPTLWQWLNRLSGSHSKQKTVQQQIKSLLNSPSLTLTRVPRLSPQYLSAQSPDTLLQLGKL